MVDITVSSIVKSFEIGNNILDGVSFHIQQGERVGLLGRNGAGKTTLFKILTGEYSCDQGEVSIAPGRRLGLISQIPVYPPGYTVEMVLDTAFERIHAMEDEMRDIAVQMERGQDNRTLLDRYDSLTAQYEAEEGYDTKIRLNKVCAGLGIGPEMQGQLFESLSGGEKTRVNLGRLILEDTDILLLDEPTNHLDLHAVEWLEDYLSRFKGTVLAISHDRYFLDRCVNRIIELEGGKATFYSGSYSFYAEEKERRYQEQLRQWQKEQAKLAQLEEASEKLRLWAFKGNDKTYRRAVSMEKRMERLKTTDRPRQERSMKAGFASRDFFGDMLFTVKDLSMGYGGRTLFSGLNLEVLGGERIALLGDNGTGKSTFIKLLLGEEEPDTGKVRFGPTVKWGYLPQVVRFSHPERTLVDTLLWEKNYTAQEARDRLAAFRFRGEDAFKQVCTLSGGEQSRLRLCMLMDEKINLLVLDEPTNHLDIASREWIEEAVRNYDGALLFVSHDRYFIQKFATRIWVLEDGAITDFRGDFDAWRDYTARRVARMPELPSQSKPEKKGKTRHSGGAKQLEKQVAAAERAVERAEIRLDEIGQEMEEYSSNYLRLQEMYEEREQLEDELAHLYAEWERLAEELEEARNP